MRIHTRIFLGLLFVLSIAFALSLYWITEELEPQYRKATEEPLVDASRILASLAGQMIEDDTIDVQAFDKAHKEATNSPFTALIYDFEKHGMDFRVYITDADGIVLYDSENPANVGEDFSLWNDVYRTLRGEYGARSTRDDPEDPSSSVMFVAAPIVVDGSTVGVLSVGKPTSASAQFVRSAQKKIFLFATVLFLSVILVVALLSAMVTKPIHKLTAYARSVRDGARSTPPSLAGREIRELGQAFEEMRGALDGKTYIEEYVQTLTHEVKSPLSAIQGAAELLKEEMNPEQKERFLQNILSETQRIGAVVEKLLLLSSLEASRDIREVRTVSLAEIIRDTALTFEAQMTVRELRFEVTGENDCIIQGDPFLLRHAVSNLLQNAVEFSPRGGQITLDLTCPGPDTVSLSIRDQGDGIPEYARGKIFDRFFSLVRPDSGKKSSGLGLSLVREVAALHFGKVEIVNAPDGGIIATLILPKKHRDRPVVGHV